MITQEDAVLDKDRLLIKRVIVGASIPVESIAGISGVYFLIDNQTIVYVGQSNNVGNRVLVHKQEGRIKFDKFSYIQCELDELNIIESLYIHAYRPKHNGDVGKTFGTMKSAPLTFKKIVEVCKEIK